MANIYPSLDGRHPAPAFVLPTVCLLFAITPLFSSTAVRVSIFALLLTVTLSSPSFAAKELNDDYGRGSISFLFSTLFLDLLILSKRGSIKFIGPIESPHDSIEGVSSEDCNTTWQKFRWGLRLAATPRGIGWNFQVKGVPRHPDKDLPRGSFVPKFIILSGRSWLYKLLFQYLIRFAVAGRECTSSWTAHMMFDILEGWSGACWAAVGLNQLYRLAAAISVGIGLCGPCEWPPFFGNWSDGWSVRQIWSSSWHQLLRRALQQPGISLARTFGLRKGSIGSSYLQLYTAFTISMLLHKWCMFNAIHGSAGEFQFFMAQPLAITLEDLVQWFWRQSGSSRRHRKFARACGYCWTFVWFSYCLPPFVGAQRAVGIVDGDLGNDPIKSAAQRHITWLIVGPRTR